MSFARKGRGSSRQSRGALWQHVVGVLAVASFVSACSNGRPLTPTGVEKSEGVAREVSARSAPVHVELTQLTYRLETNGTYQRTSRQRYRILDQDGVDTWSHSQAYWSPWYMKRPKISATVTNRDATGKAVELSLDPARISEQPAYPDAPEMYSDARLLRAPLPSVAVGSVVEEVIAVSTYRPFLSSAHMQSVPIQIGVPQDKVELIVDVPEGLEVLFEVREAKVERSEETKGGRTRYVFRGGPFQGIEPPEPFAPSSTPSWPSIEFGTSTDWKSLAKTYSELVDRRLEGIDFSTTVSEVVSKGDSDVTKAGKLYGWVKSKIRYVGIEFGESSVVPRAPDETVSHGYGDCKDQAILLVGLLRAAGLPAHVALLNAGQREDINDKFAAFNVFNHMIVVVPAETPIWLDPTAEFVRPGCIPIGDQGRLALVATEDSEGLTRLPEAASSTNTYLEQREVFLSTHGRARIVERSQATGYMDSELRSTFARPAPEVEKGLAEYGERAYYTKAIGKVEHGAARDILLPFDVKLEASESTIAFTEILEASAEAREDVLMSWLPPPLTETAGERKSTLVLPVPYEAELRWTLHPPPGYEPSALPDPLSLDLGPARLSRSVTRGKDHTVEIRSRYTTGKARYSPAEVKAFREALWKYHQSLVPHVNFVHAAKKLLDAGDPVAAVKLVRRELDKSPKDAFARMRLAWTLAPYLLDAAREEARRAVALEPQNPVLYRELGTLLSQNAIGSDLGYGFDRAGALAAYRRASELDPKDTESKLRTAVVLEHDENGKRYGSSDLTEAIAIYDSVSEKTLREFSDGAFRNNALFALYWAKRHDELAGRLAALGREEIPAELAVMNAALRSGPDGAMSEARRLTLAGADLAAALEAASGALVLQRDYAAAARLVEAAIDSTNDATRLRTRARVLRKLTKVDAAKLPEHSPKQVVTKVVALALGGAGNWAETAQSVLSQRATGKSGKSTLKDELGQMEEGADTSAVPREVTADIGVGGLDLKVEGDDKVGYRLRATLDYGSATRFDVYVVKEAGKYRVRAFGSHLAELGAEALNAATKGDKKAAAQWLDWAREAFHAVGGEDPLRVEPFARLYDKGKGDLLVAAAALASTSLHAAEALPILEKARAETADVERGRILEHALALAYGAAEEPSKQLSAARSLEEALPRSEIAQNLVLGALWRLERYGDHAREIRTLLKGTGGPRRTMLLGWLALGQEAQGQLGEAQKLSQELIDSGDADGSRYNNHAWLGLFVGAKTKDLDHSLKAVEMERSASRLHTLACIYAELGRVADAGRTLREVVEMHKNQAFEPADWFIVGRMAEQFGIEEAALRAYAKVEKSSKPWPTSTYELAQRRVKTLRR